MKKETLYEILGDIDETHIIAARTPKKRTAFLKWSTFAACLAIAMFAGLWLFSDKVTPNSSTKAHMLPMLTLTADDGGAMGFEGYLAYDISELTNQNPWNKTAKLPTLPVYQNQLTYDSYFRITGVDFDAMKALLLDVAMRLGMDTDSLIITNNTPDEAQQAVITEKLGEDASDAYFAPTAVIVESNGVKIEVDATLTADITFDPAISLPKEYNYTDAAPYKDVEHVAEYLKETYKNLIGMNNPQINISGGDYNIYREQGYDITFYDKKDNPAESIINYNFHRVAFYCDHNGDVRLARIYRPDLSDKMGDYPIITANEAQKLLLNGNYITTVPYEMPGRKYISKVELIYRTGTHEEYFMPYYRFYIELPEETSDDGLKSYGAYYVPAVEEAYISNMPVWDGAFN